ncbi:MAG: hypothetical protein ABH857_04080 [Elusimicrobiota bacterium]
MRRIITSLLVVFLFALTVSGCGDNRTKEKIIGTGVVSSKNITSMENGVDAVKSSIDKVTGFTTLLASADDNSAGSMSAFNAFSSKMRTLEDGDDGGLDVDPDGWATAEGEVKYPDGTTEAFLVRMQMLDADGNAILSESLVYLASKAHIILTTPTLSFETIVELIIEESRFGVIYYSKLTFVHTDGLTYTITLENITCEDVITQSGEWSIPVAGTGTVEISGNNFKMTLVFGKTNGEYTCNGVITLDNETARLYLTFNGDTGLYDGYYVLSNGAIIEI